MDFEKWHALGNDYMIIEATALPFELTEPRIRKLCAVHTGVGADGILLLSESDQPGYAARLRIFNPDGSEAELSGNGAREAVLYMRRRGWTSAETFSIETAAGEIRPTITSETTCTLDMGRARLRSSDYPAGPEDGRGELTAAGRSWPFQHVQVGNPQCAIRIESEAELEALDLAVIGPAIEHHELFSSAHQRLLVHRARPVENPSADLRAWRWGDHGQRHRRHRGSGSPCPSRRRVAGDCGARGWRARGGGGGGPSREPDRVGGSRLPGCARRRPDQGAA